MDTYRARRSEVEDAGKRHRRRRRRLLQELAIRSLIALAIIVFLVSISTPPGASRTVLGLAVLALALGAPYYLVGRTGRWPHTQAYVRMLVDVALVTVGLWSAGGLAAAPFLSIYLVVPVYAGIVFSSAACLVATGASTTAYVVVVALQQTGWLALPPMPPHAPAIAAFNLIVLNLAGGLTALLAQALRASRERLQATHEDLERFVEAIPDVLYVVDTAGRLCLWNRRLEVVTGLGAAQLAGRRLAALVVEDTREVVTAALADGMERGRFEVEATLRGPDGALVPHHWTGAALRDTAGTVVGLTGVGRDVTERARAAEILRQRESELRQFQKFDAMGRLAGGVAHDFNNLLTVVMGRSQLVLSQLATADPLRPHLEMIEETAQRAAALTRQLLAFGRKQALEPRVLDLNAVVAGVVGMLERLIGEHLDLVTALDPALGAIRADQGQLEQVIVNLAVNARDAMPTAGRLTISTHNEDLDAARVSAHPGAAPGPYVVLTVRDTGAGMDAETRLRVFEPFFTTKEPGKGTGLGLATVYGIVKQHGGIITVDSEPGHGSTFIVYLPRVEAAVTAADVVPGAWSPTGGEETILLVEDEEDVRALAAEILRRQGYRVLTAPAGEAALRLAVSHGDPIHLLLTDVVMPGMNGPDLAALVTMMRPATRVLYMSGYAEETAGLEGALLRKPFGPDALARRVRRVLDQAVTEPAPPTPLTTVPAGR
jgi:PAS domain S-box-containing protein